MILKLMLPQCDDLVVIPRYFYGREQIDTSQQSPPMEGNMFIHRLHTRKENRHFRVQHTVRDMRKSIEWS